MSITPMKKMTVLSLRSDADALVRRMMALRCVDVTIASLSDEELSQMRCDEEIRSIEELLAQTHTAIQALSPYSKRKKGLFATKPTVDRAKFQTEGLAEQASFTVTATNKVIARQNEIKNELTRLEGNASSLKPWLTLDIPLQIHQTRCTNVLYGSFPVGIDQREAGKHLYEANAVIEKVSEDTSGVYAAIFCCKEDTPEVLRLLTSYGFLRVNFKEDKENRGTAAAQYKRIQKQMEDLRTESAALTDKLRSLSDNLTSVEILYDITETSLVAAKNRQKMACTESVSILTGWIPAPAEKKVVDALEKLNSAYEIAEPTEEDDPPILLQNNGFAKNFEWVLGMYSYPAYGRFDPTFIMGIFYFIIFGIMFADAGYGLILMLAGFLGPLLLKPKESMKRFLLMFGYCGISCVIFGVLFGSYFGDLPLAIMKNMMGIPEDQLPNLALMGADAANLALLLDPLQDPMGFLIFSLAVGAIHLVAGMAVNFYILCRDGHPIDALLDIGLYWVLFAGFGLLVALPSIGLWVTLGAAVAIVLTHGRKEKKIFSKITKGLLGLYDLINFASDLLSYSRILALGLAAAVIAQVVNILGTMGGPTVVGFIVLVIAFVVGHLLNLAINVLGTFVHTSRLQYIEFFGKFYEDGGTPFRPALPADKYTNEP